MSREVGSVGDEFPEVPDTSFIHFCQHHRAPFAIGPYFAPFLPFGLYHAISPISILSTIVPLSHFALFVPLVHSL